MEVVMRNTIIMAGATIALFAASAVQATEATGTVKSVDSATREVVMENGHKFEAAKGVDLSKLKAGEKVTVTFEEKGGKNEASAIHMAK
jgi:Cu/Ag efflux protein CusF